MKTLAPTQTETRLARPIAAEDLVRGDMVAVLNEIGEYVSFLWNGDAQVMPPHEPVRIQWRTGDRGKPLKIKEICLPFVFVKTPNGKYDTLDIRQCQLVKLDRCYAQRVWKKLKKKGK